MTLKNVSILLLLILLEITDLEMSIIPFSILKIPCTISKCFELKIGVYNPNLLTRATLWNFGAVTSSKWEQFLILQWCCDYGHWMKTNCSCTLILEAWMKLIQDFSDQVWSPMSCVTTLIQSWSFVNCEKMCVYSIFVKNG